MLRLAGRASGLHTKHVALCTIVCAAYAAYYALITPGYTLTQALVWPGPAISSDTPLSPQVHNLGFNRFMLNNGLSQGTLNCIARDRQEFMGFGTQDEDSRCFVHYRHDAQAPNTLSDGGGIVFYWDRASDMWIGAEASGGNLYDPSWTKCAHHRLLTVPDERTSNNSIGRLYADPHSLDARGRALWLATWLNPLYQPPVRCATRACIVSSCYGRGGSRLPPRHSRTVRGQSGRFAWPSYCDGHLDIEAPNFSIRGIPSPCWLIWMACVPMYEFIRETLSR